MELSTNQFFICRDAIFKEHIFSFVKGQPPADASFLIPDKGSVVDSHEPIMLQSDDDDDDVVTNNDTVDIVIDNADTGAIMVDNANVVEDTNIILGNGHSADLAYDDGSILPSRTHTNIVQTAKTSAVRDQKEVSKNHNGTTTMLFIRRPME
ncbi:hypothetical protein HAX54_016773 [Datura stramonium]|uniref:Uncharacterized protein n=1 Tax=Datura stramonium TaxID=4076 RepID=A0ABS8ULT8_DATST|nr:hypothetical protein [Datura stramonium]